VEFRFWQKWYFVCNLKNSNYYVAWIFSLHLVITFLRHTCDYLVSHLVTFLSAFGNWNVLPESGSVLHGGGVNGEYNMKLTNSMEQSSSWEANRSSTSRAMPGILWSLKFHHCIPKSLLTEYEMLYCNVVHFITNICGCHYWKWLVERVCKVLEESKISTCIDSMYGKHCCTQCHYLIHYLFCMQQQMLNIYLSVPM